MTSANTDAHSSKCSHYSRSFGSPDGLEWRDNDEKAIEQSTPASKCGRPDGRARPAEDLDAERWRAAGLYLFRAAGLKDARGRPRACLNSIIVTVIALGRLYSVNKCWSHLKALFYLNSRIPLVRSSCLLKGQGQESLARP